MKTDAHTGIKLTETEKLEFGKVAETLGYNMSSLMRALTTAFLVTYKLRGGFALPLQFKAKTDISLEEIMVCINSVKTFDELKDIIYSVIIPGYPLSFDTPVRPDGFHERELKAAIEKRLAKIRNK